MKNLELFLLIGILMVACDGNVTQHSDPNAGIKKDASGKIIEGEFHSFRNDGTLYSTAIYKDYKKNGKAIIFYKDGVTPKNVLFFHNDKKEGVQKYYYESGKLYRKTNYLRGRKDGVETKYRENGMVYAVIEYKDGQPGKGLKEYLTNGKLKKKYPHIIIDEIDHLGFDGSFTLKVYMSDKSKRVEYFEGLLTDGRFFNNKCNRMVPVKNGVLTISFQLAPGHFIIRDLHLIAKLKTRLNNYYIDTKTYHMAIENKLR